MWKRKKIWHIWYIYGKFNVITWKVFFSAHFLVCSNASTHITHKMSQSMNFLRMVGILDGKQQHIKVLVIDVNETLSSVWNEGDKCNVLCSGMEKLNLREYQVAPSWKLVWKGNSIEGWGKIGFWSEIDIPLRKMELLKLMNFLGIEFPSKFWFLS